MTDEHISNAATKAQSERGILLGIAAYSLWGLFPLYWKMFHDIPALELVCHRIVWSFVFLTSILLITRKWTAFRILIMNPRILMIYAIAALLIGVNWLTYIWAVNAGFIVESSLGYFINPLISVLLGVVFLRERLRIGQWIPIVLATGGVVYLTLAYGSLPWIALILAFSFALYGLVKKTASLGSMNGLTLETAILLVPAMIYLLVREWTGQGAFLHGGVSQNLLILGAGPVTSIPLLLFSGAARRIPLSLVGIIQYISPTLTFLLGVWVYHEPFTRTQLIGFSAVWVALIVYTVEGLYHQLRNNNHRIGSKL